MWLLSLVGVLLLLSHLLSQLTSCNPVFLLTLIHFHSLLLLRSQLRRLKVLLVWHLPLNWTCTDRSLANSTAVHKQYFWSAPLYNCCVFIEGKQRRSTPLPQLTSAPHPSCFHLARLATSKQTVVKGEHQASLSISLLKTVEKPQTQVIGSVTLSKASSFTS